LQDKFWKILIVIVSIGVIAVLVFLFVNSSPKEERQVLGNEIVEQGRNHISQGSKDHGPYNSSPPTSGPHWPTPAECKIYDDQVPDEAAIHSLEHGAIWITYKDKNDGELVNKLKDLVSKNPSKVLLSPREANDSTIALASWARLLKVEEFDGEQINNFIKSNRNTGPEPFAQC